MKRTLLAALCLLLAALLPAGCAAAPDGSASSAPSPGESRAAASSAGESGGVSSPGGEAAAVLDLSPLAQYEHRAAATAQGVTVYKDLRYGTREDRADEGKGYGGGQDRNRHRSGQYFDLYVPDGADPDTPVLLYLHGGSWSQDYDKDGDEYGSPVPYAAQSGWIVFSMDYILQADFFARADAAPLPGATFAAMERDVDAMVGCMKTLLSSLGSRAEKFAIAGASAGAHLAALYAWDQSAPQRMGLSLSHAMPVGYLVSIGGPLDLSSDRAVKWMTTLRAVDPAGEKLFSALTGAASAETAISAVKYYSPLALIGEQTVPSIIAYSHLPADQDPYVPYGMSGDGVVESSSYDNVVAALEQAGVPHANVNIEGAHCAIDGEWLLARMKEFNRYL